MVVDLTDHDRRNAAFFAADAWRHLFNRFRHQPTPQDAVVTAHGFAKMVIEAATRSPFPGQPQSLASILGFSGGVVGYKAQDVTRAEAVIKYFDIAGDNAKASEKSITIDRNIADMLAEQRMRNQSFSIEKVAAAVKLSRPSTHERYKLRCARIMKALHNDCPDIFDAKGCPVREGRGTSRNWDTAKVAA
jgi:hypothetical protein